MRATFDVRMGNPDDRTRRCSRDGLAALLGGQDHAARCSSARAPTTRASSRPSRSRSSPPSRRTAAASPTSLYPDEGHGFAAPENRIDFNARAEAFLAAELGGRVEPLAGDKVPGSTATVKEVGKKMSAR